MNEKINQNFNTLEQRIIRVVETCKKKEIQKENLIKQLESYKKKFNEELMIEHEKLEKQIDLLQKEREEIKQRIIRILNEISMEEAKSLQVENN